MFIAKRQITVSALLLSSNHCSDNGLYLNFKLAMQSGKANKLVVKPERLAPNLPAKEVIGVCFPYLTDIGYLCHNIKIIV